MNGAGGLDVHGGIAVHEDEVGAEAGGDAAAIVEAEGVGGGGGGGDEGLCGGEAGVDEELEVAVDAHAVGRDVGAGEDGDAGGVEGGDVVFGDLEVVEGEGALGRGVEEIELLQVGEVGAEIGVGDHGGAAVGGDEALFGVEGGREEDAFVDREVDEGVGGGLVDEDVYEAVDSVVHGVEGGALTGDVGDAHHAALAGFAGEGLDGGVVEDGDGGAGEGAVLEHDLEVIGSLLLAVLHELLRFVGGAEGGSLDDVGGPVVGVSLGDGGRVDGAELVGAIGGAGVLLLGGHLLDEGEVAPHVEFGGDAELGCSLQVPALPGVGVPVDEAGQEGLPGAVDGGCAGRHDDVCPDSLYLVVDDEDGRAGQDVLSVEDADGGDGESAGTGMMMRGLRLRGRGRGGEESEGERERRHKYGRSHDEHLCRLG